MWLHASVLLNWVLLSEWSGRRGEVYDFGGLGYSQRLPLSVWVVPATLRVPVAGWPQKRELGPLSSGQGKLMPFVDPDRIEQSDRVQAASFAPDKWSQHSHWMLVWVHSILDPKHPLSCADPDSYFILQMVHHRYQPKEEGYCGYLT